MTLGYAVTYINPLLTFFSRTETREAGHVGSRDMHVGSHSMQINVSK